jgi:DNA-binding XRE family transcriptional regulator
LFLALQTENLKDMRHKGREAVGTQKGRSKLTEPQIREIRKRYASGTISQRELASEYPISRQTLGEIVRREIWKHVG